MSMKTILAVLFLTAASLPIFAADICYELDDPAVKFAAGDLGRCLGIVTGREYRRLNGPGGHQEGDIALRVEPHLQSQEWHFQSDGRRLTISGRDGMGIVYGIYTFLEKFAGCSWLGPDTELLPKNPQWVLPVLDEKGRPVFLRREMYTGPDGMDGVWRLRNKENNRAVYGVNLHVGSPGDCHTFDDYVEALKDRPDLFGPSVSGGKCGTLCMTNPEVRSITLAELVKNI